MSLESLQAEGIIPTPKEEWRVKLRKKFFSKGYAAEIYLADIESFIEKTLAAERARIAEQIEKHKEEMSKKYDNFSCWDEYNDALGFVLSLLQTPYKK